MPDHDDPTPVPLEQILREAVRREVALALAPIRQIVELEELGYSTASTEGVTSATLGAPESLESAG